MPAAGRAAVAGMAGQMASSPSACITSPGLPQGEVDDSPEGEGVAFFGRGFAISGQG